MTMATSMASTTALYPPTISPPERPLPLYRFVFRFLQNPLLALPQQAYEQPALVYQPGERSSTIIWVTAPELTEIILQNRSNDFVKTPLEKRVFRRTVGESVLTADGSDWRWQRRAIAPLFRHGEILSYVPAMAAASAELVAQWHGQAKHRRDIEKDMTDVTFSVIARTMLAGGEPTESAAIKRAGQQYLDAIPWEMIWELLRVPGWLPHPAQWWLDRTARTMRGAVADIVARRRAAGGEGNDLLARLLAARHPDTGEAMSDEGIVDNLLTMLFAGHETTAKALAWTLYLLARAPAWQDQVRAEVRDVIGDDEISVDHVDRLAVCERVLKEAMRLYPPVPVIARRPVRDVNIGGYDIPADAQVVIPMFCLHRHRELWRDPDRFDPDRFLPDASADLPRTQYMPFGGGARTCIGNSFAMVEAKVLLAAFVRAAAFAWDGHHRPQPVSRITLRPKGGMPLIVTPLA